MRTQDGRIFRGAYLENAAFNPSLSPLQAALVAAVLGGVAETDLVEAVVVQLEEARIDHAGIGRFVLERFAPAVTLERYVIRKASI